MDYVCQEYNYAQWGRSKQCKWNASILRRSRSASTAAAARQHRIPALPIARDWMRLEIGASL